jgi:hypothetical protein
LIDSHLIVIDDFLALLELHSPGMLKLLYEVVHDNITAIMQDTHEFHELNLSGLDNHDRSALLVRAMEAVRQKRLYFVVLRKLEVLFKLAGQKFLPGWFRYFVSSAKSGNFSITE